MRNARRRSFTVFYSARPKGTRFEENAESSMEFDEDPPPLGVPQIPLEQLAQKYKHTYISVDVDDSFIRAKIIDDESANSKVGCRIEAIHHRSRGHRERRIFTCLFNVKRQLERVPRESNTFRETKAHKARACARARSTFRTEGLSHDFHRRLLLSSRANCATNFFHAPWR